MMLIKLFLYLWILSYKFTIIIFHTRYFIFRNSFEIFPSVIFNIFINICHQILLIILLSYLIREIHISIYDKIYILLILFFKFSYSTIEENIIYSKLLNYLLDKISRNRLNKNFKKYSIHYTIKSLIMNRILLENSPSHGMRMARHNINVNNYADTS